MKILWSVMLLLCVSSCAMLGDIREGLAPAGQQETFVRCPFCKKQISDQDRKCPFCGRDVNYDLGNDMVDREVQRITDDRDGR